MDSEHFNIQCNIAGSRLSDYTAQALVSRLSNVNNHLKEDVKIRLLIFEKQQLPQ